MTINEEAKRLLLGQRCRWCNHMQEYTIAAGHSTVTTYQCGKRGDMIGGIGDIDKDWCNEYSNEPGENPIQWW